MTNALKIAALIAAMLGLSGCDRAGAPSAAGNADATPGMATSVSAKTGKGTGTVTAIDAAAGKITLDHGAIAAVGWPAMKMDFSAQPDLLAGMAVGDQVDFVVNVTGSEGQVTAMRKR